MFWLLRSQYGSDIAFLLKVDVVNTSSENNKHPDLNWVTDNFKILIWYQSKSLKRVIARNMDFIACSCFGMAEVK